MDKIFLSLFLKLKAFFSNNLNSIRLLVVINVFFIALSILLLIVSCFYFDKSQPISNLPTIKKNTDAKILVDLEGAVELPGVYEIKNETTVLELLDLAKGLTDKADKSYVAKNLNLSRRLNNEDKIYIPYIDELASSGSERISINNASKTELQLLTGIGAVKAEKIVISRPFSSLSELVSKKILSQKNLEQIQNEITL